MKQKEKQLHNITCNIRINRFHNNTVQGEIASIKQIILYNYIIKL